MFVFPLGLEAKTKDFPWATVALLAMNIGYSVHSFDATQAYQVARFNRPSARSAAQAQLALAAAACAPPELSAEECVKLRGLVQSRSIEGELDARRALTASPKATAYVFNDKRWRASSPLLTELPEYQAFTQATAAADHDLAAMARAEDVLTRNGLTPKSLVRSQFLHAGWMHLLGNMAFLAVFAIPLEARFGALMMLFIYFVGGSLGDLTQLFSGSTDRNVPLIGASADVFALGGAFLIAFFRRSLRVWTTFFLISSRTVLMPTWAFFIGFLLLSEATSALSSGDNVAHLAHLGAFLPGLVFGVVALRLRPLDDGCVFPFERTWLAEATKELTTSPTKALPALHRLLIFHEDSRAALALSWQALEHEMKTSWRDLAGEARRFARAHFAATLNARADAGPQALSEALDQISASDWPPSQLAPSQPLAIALAAQISFLAYAHGLPGKALVLNDWLLSAHPPGGTKLTPAVRLRLIELRRQVSAASLQSSLKEDARATIRSA